MVAGEVVMSNTISLPLVMFNVSFLAMLMG